MILIPFKTSAKTYQIFVALEDDNLDRLKAYDPAQVKFPLPGWERFTLENVHVGYLSAADRPQFLALVEQGLSSDVLRFLSRGFEFRPDLGDHDGPAISLLLSVGEVPN